MNVSKGHDAIQGYHRNKDAPLWNNYKTKYSNSCVGRQNYLAFTECTEFLFDNKPRSFFMDASIFMTKAYIPLSI
jgi:hypothetical protein